MSFAAASPSPTSVPAILFAAQGAAIYTAAGITGLPTPPPSGGVPALNFLDGSYPYE